MASACWGAAASIGVVRAGTIEIGYWLRPDAVGRGVMTATARALTTAAFALDGIARVEIRCDVGERAAVRRSPG